MRRRRLPLALIACCPFALLTIFLVAACGDDDGGPSAVPTDPGGTSTSILKGTPPTSSTASTASPLLAGPAGKYSILLDDVGPSFLTDIPRTFVLDAKTYAATKTFDSAATGASMLKQWGYSGGFETGLIPEGRDAAILNGAFYVHLELHLFDTVEGAQAAYTYFRDRVSKNGIAEPVSMEGIGNDSAAFKSIYGTIPGSSVADAFHQVIFRRGNLVVILATDGAEPFMKIDSAHELAAFVDKKALGEVPATDPTPTSNFTPTIYPTAVRTATPTRSPKR